MLSLCCKKNKVPRLTLGVCLMFSTTAWADFSGALSFTSDYVWRGSSQTREAPATQASIKYSFDSGIYASVWGSNVKYLPTNGASSEFDLALGYRGVITPAWQTDLALVRYQYPDADTDLNWNEFNANLIWQEKYSLSVGYSPDAMASATQGTWVQLGAQIPLIQASRAEGTLAHYFLESRYGKSYSHASSSLVWAFYSPAEARFTLHVSDQAAKELFPEMAGSRVEFALQTSF